MGACGGQGPNPNRKTATSKYNQFEIDMLKMMYDNLAARCKGKILSREVFQIFFHCSGLFGEVMFTKFNCEKSGQITFQQFTKGLELMVKGSFKQKADVLFDFYDIDKTGGINYNELLKMLFSYPTEELQKMFTQEKFIEYLGNAQMTYYFGPQHKDKIEDKTIVEEVSEQNSEGDFPARKGSVYAPSSSQFIQIQGKIMKAVEEHRQNKKSDVPAFIKKASAQPRTKFSNGKMPKKIDIHRHQSISELQIKRNRKNLQIKSNISTLVKKYAHFLFTSLKLDKEKDKFSKQQFLKLLSDHPSIFNVYFSGFHTYIWLTDNENPQFYQITPWLQHEALQIYQEKEDSRYLKFIRSTIFVFNYKKSKKPIEVINLQGLYAQPIIKNQTQFGVVFKHRDGLYPQKEYYFQSKQIQEEWLKQLSQFKQNSIYDSFIINQKIGAGNFSTVFKGIEKKSNKPVAIKVIQNYKLSLNEKEVLKRECGIMKLCHHPNIIKFLQEYKTKTHLYIVMELLEEGDLFEYVKKNSFLEEYEAAIIFKQIVDAINYLNELGIIHRDLKPQNVMVVLNEEKKMCKRVKLIDFGFALYKDQLKDLSPKEKFAGTPGFIAPEVLNGEDYDQKVDTFSLGIILYFMLGGFLPFHSNYYQQIVELTKSCSISLSNAHWSNVSENAKDLIYKILTFKEYRISTKQVYEHPWLQNIDELKAYQGKNKKKGYSCDI